MNIVLISILSICVIIVFFFLLLGDTYLDPLKGVTYPRDNNSHKSSKREMWSFSGLTDKGDDFIYKWFRDKDVSIKIGRASCRERV